MNNVKKCYVDTTLRVIGGKWKLLILWHLNQSTLRFSELEKRLVGVSQKMLTQQLREMEKDKLISRKVFAVVPPRVEYSITKYGQSLDKVLDELGDWGEKYHKHHSL